MRLPRAEDRVVMFIDVDGETIRAEGEIQRITLHASAGIDMLRGQIRPEALGASGEINVQLNRMMPIVGEEVEIHGNHGVIKTITLPPEIRP